MSAIESLPAFESSQTDWHRLPWSEKWRCFPWQSSSVRAQIGEWQNATINSSRFTEDKSMTNSLVAAHDEVVLDDV